MIFTKFDELYSQYLKHQNQTKGSTEAEAIKKQNEEKRITEELTKYFMLEMQKDLSKSEYCYDLPIGLDLSIKYCDIMNKSSLPGDFKFEYRFIFDVCYEVLVWYPMRERNVQ
jgi:hypothetical protein